MMNGLPKTFEELREQVWDMKDDAITSFIEHIDDETTLSDVHRLRGEVIAYDNVLYALRSVIKYGDVE